MILRRSGLITSVSEIASFKIPSGYNVFVILFWFLFSVGCFSIIDGSTVCIFQIQLRRKFHWSWMLLPDMEKCAKVIPI